MHASRRGIEVAGRESGRCRLVRQGDGAPPFHIARSRRNFARLVRSISTMRASLALLALAVLAPVRVARPQAAAAPPDIFLVRLIVGGGPLGVSLDSREKLRNITDRSGYDNQP